MTSGICDRLSEGCRPLHARYEFLGEGAMMKGAMMKDAIDPRSIGPKIRMMMPNLTPLEARVVDSVFSRKDFTDVTSLKQVADEAGVSEAMVVKIAKKLGFSGYRDFRQNVASYSRLQTAELQEELSPEDTGREIVNKVFRASMRALEETLAIADVEAFERAAEFIQLAGQRDLYGVGG